MHMDGSQRTKKSLEGHRTIYLQNNIKIFLEYSSRSPMSWTYFNHLEGGGLGISYRRSAPLPPWFCGCAWQPRWRLTPYGRGDSLGTKSFCWARKITYSKSSMVWTANFLSESSGQRIGHSILIIRLQESVIFFSLYGYTWEIGQLSLRHATAFVVRQIYIYPVAVELLPRNDEILRPIDNFIFLCEHYKLNPEKFREYQLVSSSSVN